MVKKLSALLLQEHVVSPELLDEALQRQVIFGGRLGTNLLELGTVSEEELSAFLGRTLELPPAPRALFADFDANALELISEEQSRELGLLPVRLRSDGTADALVTSPLPLDAQEQLLRRHHFRFTLYLTPEFRFLQAHHHFYGRPLPERFARLAERYPLPIRLGTPSRLTRSGVHQAQRRPLGPPGFGWTLDEVAQYLRDCYIRDRILEVLLGFTGGFAQRRMLLVVLRNHLQGYLSITPDIPNERLRRVKLRVRPGGSIDRVCQGDTYYQGHPADGDLDPLYEALGLDTPASCLLLPIPVGNRAGLVLLMDHGARTLDPALLEPLFITINEVSEALEKIIRLTKLDQLPPEELRIPPYPERIRQLRDSASALSAVTTSPSSSALSAPPSTSPLATSAPRAHHGDNTPTSPAATPTSSPALVAALQPLIELDHAALAAPQPQPSAPDNPVKLARRQTRDMVQLLETIAPAPDPAPLAELARLASLADPLAQHDEATPAEPFPDAPQATAPPASEGPPLPAEPARLDTGGWPETNLGSLGELGMQPKAQERSALDPLLGAVALPSSSSAPGLPPSHQTSTPQESRSRYPRPVGADVFMKDAPSSPLLIDGWDMPDLFSDKLPESEVESIGLPSRDLSSSQDPEEEVSLHPSIYATLQDAERALPTESQTYIPEPLPSDMPRLSIEPERVQEEDGDKGLYFDFTDHQGQPAPQYAPPPAPAEADAETVERPVDSDLLAAWDAPLDMKDDEGLPPALEALLAHEAHEAHEPAAPQEPPYADEAPQPERIPAVALGASLHVPSLEPTMAAPDVLDVSLVELGSEEEQEEAPQEVAPGEPAGHAPSEATEATSAQEALEALLDVELVELEPLEEVEPLEVERPVAVTPGLAPETAHALQTYLPAVEALCGEDREQARQARAQLLSAGGAALPALLSRFPGPTRVDRYSSSLGALPPLEQHGPLLDVVVGLGDLAAPAIASLLDVPGVDVRFYASLFFLRVRYEPILQAMYERLFDKDTQVREVVRHVLRSYRHAPAFRRLCEELHRALRGRDLWQIEQAAHALGAFHDPRAVPYLVELLETPQRRIAEVAHRELCRICLDDLGPQRRKWQRWWEDNAARPRWSWLVEAMNQDQREVRVRAALELRQVPGLLVNYNPDAPRAERSRAQVIATQFFEDSPHGRV